MNLEKQLDAPECAEPGVSSKARRRSGLLPTRRSNASIGDRPRRTPLGQRALPAGSESRQLVQLEVLKPLPMQQSNVMPWFGQEGMGVQFQSTTSGLVLPNGAPTTLENPIKAKYLKVISP